MLCKEAYPTSQSIQSSTWSLRTHDGRTITPSLRFLDDGRLSGYEHYNEASWSFIDGLLGLCARDGRVSTRFDEVRVIARDLIELSGRFLLHPELNLTMILTQHVVVAELKGIAQPISLEFLLQHSWLIAIDGVIQPTRELILGTGGQVRRTAGLSIAAWAPSGDGIELLGADGRCLASLSTMHSHEGVISVSDDSGSIDRPAIRLLAYRALAASTTSMDFTPERPAANTRDFLRARISGDGWEIGDHSYGQPSIFEPHMAKLTIGSFTSIAANVAIALGNHRTDSVTTYPFASFPSIWPAAEENVSHTTKGDVHIGSDVWIGSSAFIGSGVSIGDGAVIAAHAVVTKDVEPYTIVGGNPARLIRPRFDKAIADKLLRIRWWNWDDRTIAALVPELTSNVEKFIARCERDGLLEL